MPRDGGISIEAHFPAEKIRSANAAKNDVRVRDRRLLSAAAVRDRTRSSAGTLRADLQRADFVDPGDAAATGTNLDDIDDGHHHRMATRVATNVVSLRHGRLARSHEARLRRRPAHVKGNDVLVAQRLADFRRGDDSADRARFHHHDRPRDGRFRRHDAAVGLHDREFAAEAERCELDCRLRT